MNNKHAFCFFIRVILVTVFLTVSQVLCVSAQESEVSRSQLVEKSKQHYQEGEKLYAEGNYSGADEAFKKAQDLLDYIEPPELVVEKQAAGSIPAGNNKDIAVEEEARVDYLKKALEFSNRGASQKAIPNYLKAIESIPANADIYYNLAVEYLKTKQFDLAAEAFQQVIRLNPRDKDAHYNLGVLYEGDIKDLRQAKFHYSRYVKLAKKGSDVNEVRKWIRDINEQLKLKRRRGF
ncbi:tetratricopeptide repeat protein [Candidatus Omnitrophota bacterium]